ncbi:MAG: hypothetical protein ACPG31_07130 [Planctomycetota bacterium]
MLLVLVATTGGCAMHNYDFDALSDLDGSTRGARFKQDLEGAMGEGDHEELFDIKVFPLAHTHLSVFTEERDHGIEEGYLEAKIDAYLPLFGIVDASFTRYDDDGQISEHHEHYSFLWGLFSSHLERVDTRLGLPRSFACRGARKVGCRRFPCVAWNTDHDDDHP